MGSKLKKDKTEIIREMLSKTLNKSPDLFCYYVSIMEAKELLGKEDFKSGCTRNQHTQLKKLGDL